MNNLLALVPVLIGFMIPLQAKSNSRLYSGNGDAVLTGLISVSLTVVIIGVFFLLSGRPLSLVRLPWWAYAGGVFGALYVISISWVSGKIASTQLIAALLAGQMLMAFVLDSLQNGGISLKQLTSLALVFGAVLLNK